MSGDLPYSPSLTLARLIVYADLFRAQQRRTVDRPLQTQSMHDTAAHVHMVAATRTLVELRMRYTEHVPHAIL
eukprot:CAMPEP_0183364808 /NCGR_PEP_ID=MMETSP0164_2-20130417/82063_1 /TAXON_ID=221442 /ORGANISM="Coccolithus pelagicus ssp braarudi, Strain PLY182g" /LENGTH=72 /DNA_ID=CAMNT_0025540191 /DNA_START=192 /DNA_END=410 /DNA_ORIENTATION=+